MSTRVVVKPHDPRWAEAFEEEAAKLRRALGGDLVADLHHIGSTAIPGIVAKPIIDILLEVRDIDELADRAADVEALGYEAMGEFGLPGRRFFRKDDTRCIRTHHVHAYATGNPEIDRHLAFRDFMRAHRDWAERYGRLKADLAQAHPNDIEAYMDGKDAFIQDAEARALQWRAANR